MLSSKLARRIGGAALALATSSALLVGCSETGSEAGSSSSAASGLSGTTGQLVAEGASSQQKAMDYFGTKYAAAVSGAQLAYTASGSGAGQKQFLAGKVVFGGSDSPLSAEQQEQAKQRCTGGEAWHLPLVVGPVAVAYNLDTDVTLTPQLIADIFSGKITTWNDPAIAAVNSGVSLPDTKITVVYRSDESGTTDNFQKFLKANTDWASSGKAFPTAVGSGASGSTGVADETAATKGAITYVEAGFASKLTIAPIDFGAGAVKLSNETVGQALNKLSYKGEGHNMIVDSEALFKMKEAGAYPLVLTTYEIVCSAGYTDTEKALVKDFLTTALANQDDQLQQLGYIPVSGDFKAKLEAAVAAL